MPAPPAHPGDPAGLPGRVARLLAGPHPALPRPIDALAERWARLRPRVRTLLAIAMLVVAAGVLQARLRAADARWGGAPVAVLVAASDLPVGAPAAGLRRVDLPPAAVPPGAVDEVPETAVLAMALPVGTVLTHAHLDPRGPGAGLDPSLRAVPVPVDDSWGVTAGGWVDVWVLGAGEAPARLVGRARPVLQVRGEGTGTTALVGLHVDEVGEATAGLALGRVLLAHAPPPS